MPEVTITLTLTDEQESYLRGFYPPNKYGTIVYQVAQLVASALPAPDPNPFEEGDVVYLAGAKMDPRLVQRAGHNDKGQAVVDVIDQDGNVTRGVPAQYYTKEVKHV